MQHVILKLQNKHCCLLGHCFSVIWCWLPTSAAILGEWGRLNNAYQPLTLLNKQKRNADRRQLVLSQRYLKGKLG